MAPEYALNGLLHKKDVYGFGVLIMEIIMGSQAMTRFPSFGESCFLVHLSLGGKNDIELIN